MATIAAKFWVQSVKKTQIAKGNVMREVVLQPVMDDGNTQWSRYTPSGTISLTVTDEAAGATFEEALGKDVAITFDIL